MTQHALDAVALESVRGNDGARAIDHAAAAAPGARREVRGHRQRAASKDQQCREREIMQRGPAHHPFKRDLRQEIALAAAAADICVFFER